jgi:uncharacterized protein (DUF1697 family)
MGSDRPGYAAFLRGVNVGGKNRIAMKDLASLLEALGYGGVRTYIQSGNAVFQARAEDEAALGLAIKTALGTHLGLDVEVLVRSRARLRAILEGAHFETATPRPAEGQEPEGALRPENAAGAYDGRYLTLLSRPPAAEELARLRADAKIEESWTALGDVIYTNYEHGYGKSYFNNNLIERRLALVATTRNWATMQAVLALLEA